MIQSFFEKTVSNNKAQSLNISGPHIVSKDSPNGLKFSDLEPPEPARDFKLIGPSSGGHSIYLKTYREYID